MRHPLPTVFALLALFLACAPADRAHAKSFSKEAMLRTMASEVIVPAYERLATASAKLDALCGRFAAEPSPALLNGARAACTETVLAWKAASCVLNGPVDDLELTAKFSFWPARTENIEALLAGEGALDRAAVAEQGVSTSSLFVLEYLLYCRPGMGGTTEAAEAMMKHFEGGAGARRRAFLATLASVTSERARGLAGAWAPAGGNHAAAFAKAGQESVGWLANDLIAAVEGAVEQGMNEVLDFNPAASPQDLNWIQGAPGGGSLRCLLETLRAAESIASRFEPQLRASGSAVGARLRAQFQKTIAAVEAVGGPLETVLPAGRARLEAAYQEGKTLEILIKTELLGALGVTLTFISGDGD